MELADYLRILRKRWLVILVLTLVGIAASATATLLMTPQYRATTQVFVYVPSSGTVGELAQGGSFAQNQVRSYAEAVSTPRVLDDVVASLGLDETADELGESVTAEAPLNTVNIEIAVVRESPTEAADIANATTSSFEAVIDDITSGQVSVSVLREASVPREPISPNTNLNLALGLLIGLAVGIGLAVLMEVLDTRIRGQRDVEALTQAPIIGGIAYDPNAVKRPLIVQDDPHSPRAEAFRTLRTNLQFLDIEPGARSFVITSSVPAEGKSTTSANLAIALADSGARVVIIDGDLRRPKLAEYMGLEGAVGLTDVLIQRASLGDVLQPWGRRGLSVLPAGSVPPNPSELLGSRAMQSLVHALEQEFDVVIIDMPPLLPVTDAALVSKMTKGALVVAAAGKTDRRELEGALAALENVGARVSGIIITMLPTKGPDAYGYGRYGYGGYGYTAEANAVTTPRRPKASRGR
ncbi:polysaccharide biosynthesis tyrosine autokinase [Microcella alkalica]|uniref:polysaccharide biosynthesis tyrosine autokinase n=1 Tax=Microcella alkalica TaxID=355930 RepID=UPI00145CB37C|nr:polysaccharide biosynthesis tyrosine autokinase [Microcella alkalica]